MHVQVKAITLDLEGHEVKVRRVRDAQGVVWVLTAESLLGELLEAKGLAAESYVETAQQHSVVGCLAATDELRQKIAEAFTS